jgi:hypothetical protein
MHQACSKLRRFCECANARSRDRDAVPHVAPLTANRRRTEAPVVISRRTRSLTPVRTQCALLARSRSAAFAGAEPFLPENASGGSRLRCPKGRPERPTAAPVANTEKVDPQLTPLHGDVNFGQGSTAIAPWARLKHASTSSAQSWTLHALSHRNRCATFAPHQTRTHRRWSMRSR